MTIVIVGYGNKYSVFPHSYMLKLVDTSDEAIAYIEEITSKNTEEKWTIADIINNEKLTKLINDSMKGSV